MMAPVKTIYKICDSSRWGNAEKAGVFHGAEIDITDGFIHFSTADQLASTLEKHFSGRTDLVLVAVNAPALSDKIVYEEARDGKLFPHLYGSLSTEHVLWVRPIPVDAADWHVIAEL